MDISDIGQFLPPASVQGGKKVPPQPVEQVAVSGEKTVSPARRVDMRNVSLDEINELIRAGVDGLLDVLPVSSIDIDRVNRDADGSYRAAISSRKIDFLGALEKSIEFEKSIGKSTDFLEKSLANLKRINGMEFPPGVDAIA